MASSARCMAPVAELTARAYGAPMCSANSRSKRFVLGPVVSHPERRVSTTSSISACVICGKAKGRNVLRALYFSWLGQARLFLSPRQDSTFERFLFAMTKSYLNNCFHDDQKIK